MHKIEYNGKLREKIVEVYGTQETCAYAVGITEARLSKAVRGLRPLSDQQIEKLCKRLRCEPKDIGY